MPVGRYTFKYLAPVPQYKVLLSTLYLSPVDLVPPPGTRFCTGSGTNRYMVKYIFFSMIMAMLRRLIPGSSSKYALDMEHLQPGPLGLFYK